MYISGNRFNFEERLHQLPTGRGDINNFRIEGSIYSGFVGTTGSQVYLKEKWNKEFNNKSFILFNSGEEPFK